MKKGFTLVELLAVIVILGIILVIAIPNVMKVVEKTKTNVYVRTEEILVNAAKNYLLSNVEKVPFNIDEMTIITLTDLQQKNIINYIRDPKNKNNNCSAYVTVEKKDEKMYDYKPYIKCGSNYSTVNYINSSLKSVEVLVVAGGGAGGSHKSGVSTGTGAGGGGAGGLIYNNGYTVIDNQSINVLVGAGGITPVTNGTGDKGENSSFGSLIAIGGGGGGHRTGIPSDGGSGGGRGYYSAVGGNGIAGQGYNGGGSNASTYGGSGGGGAGGIGVYNSSYSGTNGGIGIYYGNIFGDKLGQNGYFAGGGGGGSASGSTYVAGSGGIGGGGAGGRDSNGVDAIPNTGGGGGGASVAGYRGGDGGSGIVIVKYPGIQKANGGIVTTVNGCTIHTFTNVGLSTFQVLSF